MRFFAASGFTWDSVRASVGRDGTYMITQKETCSMPRGTLPRIIKDPPGRQRPLFIKLEQQIPVRNRVVVGQDRETGHGNHATIYAGDGTTFAHLIS